MLNTITVKELRALLEREDDDALVAFTSSYGDYWHTQQALGILGKIEERVIQPSGYSRSGWALVEKEVDEDGEEIVDDDDRPTVLVVS